MKIKNEFPLLKKKIHEEVEHKRFERENGIVFIIHYNKLTFILCLQEVL